MADSLWRAEGVRRVDERRRSREVDRVAEHPASLIVLFIGGIVVTVGVGGAIADETIGINGALHGETSERADDVRTSVEILNDPGAVNGGYDPTTETLTLYVKNVGGRAIPADESTVDVLVDGRYVTNKSVATVDTGDWTTGTVLRVEANVSLSPGTHRAVVVVDGARQTHRFRTAALGPNLDRDEVVFASDGASELRSVAPDGTVTAYDATVEAVGPKEVDFDGDDRLEVPYVTSGGDLKLIDEENETTTLVTGDAEADSALLGVGTWRGETSVFYVNESDSYTLYRVSPGESPSQVTADGSSLGASAAAGIADYDGDGDADVTYLGDSQEVKFVDENTDRSTGVGPGSNNNYGIGAPRTFDGTPSQVPLIDGSGNVKLLAADGTATTVLGDGSAEKTPLAGIDWTGDDDLEVVYVDGGGTLYYVTLGGSKTQVTDADGNPITVDTSVGVA
jgi:archaellum component FlaG (FlaF/FlaG flagellin family)